MKKAAFFGRADIIQTVYGNNRTDVVRELTNLYPEVITLNNLSHHAASLKDLEVIFSTWHMPVLQNEHIALLPNLKAVFYAAGTVQGFARPLLEHGIKVFSAWAANGTPVAEFTVGQILLSNKCYFRNAYAYKTSQSRQFDYRIPGNFGETVALLGAGQIGRHVIRLLKPFQLKVIVYDPFLSEEAAKEIGVEKVTLEDAFKRGFVVSNHLANNPQTVNMIRGGHLELMRPNATFINTGRGATVNETEMCTVLKQRSDLTALLDVTDPEPPEESSDLWLLPNVFLSTHIAGSVGDEVVHMADYMIDEFRRWNNEAPLRYEVTLEMLATMA